ncbi:MAG TPA: hypothetical protein VHG35_14615 [Gemmatimonadales bacterium]|nr:hypothetical protein [Gemmatimonadales bacterium]
MTTDTSAPLADGTRIGALWTANLLGPLAVLIGLEIAYIFADRACVTGDMLPVHLTWLASLLASGLAGWLGWREWRRWGGSHAGEDAGLGGRSRFLALMGMLLSAVAALVIAAQWSAAFVFHPCQ